MPSYARSQITAPAHEATTYLLTNRVVRRSWLLGYDKVNEIDYSHRKAWVEDRINHAVDHCFFMDLHTYTILSNHFHVVVTTRPDLCNLATDEEIVQRWWNLFPRKQKGWYSPVPPPELKAKMLSDRDWIVKRRQGLCSISTFMGQVTVHISRKANKEDGCKGHFWQGRFDSQILLDADAVMSANIYVDLNPIRANITSNIREIKNGTIDRRFKVLDRKTTSSQTPFQSVANPSFETSMDGRSLIDLSLEQYLEILDLVAKTKPHKQTIEEVHNRIHYRIKSFRYAVGPREKVNQFAMRRHRKRENYRR